MAHTATKPDKYAHLSPSSRWNLRFMKRTNILAIAMFLGGIIYKAIDWLTRD